MKSLPMAPQDKLHLHRQFPDYLAGKRIVPINIEISPCGVCNASCDFCWYAQGAAGSHRKTFLGTVELLRLIDDAAAMGVRSISWTGGGEPSLYPAIASAVAHVSLSGMEQGMFTNALAVPRYDPAKMTWIRVTMTDRPWNEEYIKMLRPARRLGIAFNYAGPQDDDYLRKTLDVAERCGVDYVQMRPALKFHGETVTIFPTIINHPLLHVTDYKFEQASLPHGTEYTQCEGYHFVPFVWEDGNVDVCAYMRNYEGYTLGNLYQDRLQDILDRAPASVPVHEKCQVCCRNHETNRAIHAARKLEDVNFP